VATGVVVGRILLAADQELGVEELAVGASADLIDRRRVEVDKDGPRDVFAIARLVEEGLEGATLGDVLGIGIRASVSCETVLEKVQLPSAVTQLGTSLAQVDVKNLAAAVSASSLCVAVSQCAASLSTLEPRFRSQSHLREVVDRPRESGSGNRRREDSG